MSKTRRKKPRVQVGKSLEYFDPKAPGSYAGASTFQRHHPHYKLDNLYDILSKHRSYTLHRGARRRFPRNRTITGGIDSLWDIDLADMKTYESENDGYTTDIYSLLLTFLVKKSGVFQQNVKTALPLQRPGISCLN